MSKPVKCWNGCGKEVPEGNIYCSYECEREYQHWLKKVGAA